LAQVFPGISTISINTKIECSVGDISNNLGESEGTVISGDSSTFVIQKKFKIDSKYFLEIQEEKRNCSLLKISEFWIFSPRRRVPRGFFI